MKLNTAAASFLNLILATALVLSVASCKKEVLPKPVSFLRLDYPQQRYVSLSSGYPYHFEHASGVQVVPKENFMMDLKYPKMNATLVLSYFPVRDNLKALLKDAEKLTFKHMIKADDIQSTPYENETSKV